MDKYFFHDKNISKVQTYLERSIGVNNPSLRPKIKQFVVKNMNQVYKKYGNKKPNNISNKEFLQMLNKKSAKESIDMYNKMKEQRQQNIQISELKRDRERETFGDREMMVPRRPQYTGMNKSNTPRTSEFDGFHQSSSTSSFAPLNNFNNVAPGNDMYISATGDIGYNMPPIENNDRNRQNPGNMFSNNKGGNAMELEQRMKELSMAYDRRPMPNQQNGPNQHNQQMMDYSPDFNSFSSLDQQFQPNYPQQYNPNYSQPMQNQQMQYNPNYLPPPQQNQQMQYNPNYLPPPQQNQQMQYNPNYPQQPNNQMQYNPNYSQQQHQQYQPSQQPQQSSYQPQMTEEDVNKQFERMLQERSNFNQQPSLSPPSSNQPFNPLNSPNLQYNMNYDNHGNLDINNVLQMQRQHLNFNGEVGRDISSIANTMDSKQLGEYIENLKKKIINEELVFPELNSDILSNLSIEELNELSSRLKKFITEPLTQLPPISPVNESTNQSSKSKKNKKQKEVIYNIVDDVSDKRMVKPIVEIPKLESTSLEIDPSDITDPSNYNNYLIEFTDDIKNLYSVELQSVTFPNKMYNVDLCSLLVVINDKEQTVKIPDGLYNIDKILALLNNSNIGLKFKYSNRRIIISSIDGSNFALIYNKNTVLNYLGFTNNKYVNKNTYKADKEPLIPLVNKISCFIENISDQPIGIINLEDIDNIQIEKFKLYVELDKISEFLIKFKNYNSDTLYNFKNNGHKLTLLITCKK